MGEFQRLTLGRRAAPPWPVGYTVPKPIDASAGLMVPRDWLALPCPALETSSAARRGPCWPCYGPWRAILACALLALSRARAGAFLAAMIARIDARIRAETAERRARQVRAHADACRSISAFSADPQPALDQLPHGFRPRWLRIRLLIAPPVDSFDRLGEKPDSRRLRSGPALGAPSRFFLYR